MAPCRPPQLSGPSCYCKVSVAIPVHKPNIFIASPCLSRCRYKCLLDHFVGKSHRYIKPLCPNLSPQPLLLSESLCPPHSTEWARNPPHLGYSLSLSPSQSPRATHCSAPLPATQKPTSFPAPSPQQQGGSPNGVCTIPAPGLPLTTLRTVLSLHIQAQ